MHLSDFDTYRWNFTW